MDLGNHVAVVMGWASGIGAATVERSRGCGARRVVWDLSASADIIGDVADVESVKRAIEQKVERVGVPTLLVAAAGVPGAGAVCDMAAGLGPHVLRDRPRHLSLNSGRCTRDHCGRTRRLERAHREPRSNCRGPSVVVLRGLKGGRRALRQERGGRTGTARYRGQCATPGRDPYKHDAVKYRRRVT
jgi:hypothetical protein